MALTNCKECGNQISSEAKSCPKCGAKPPYRPGIGIIIFFVTVLFFGLKSISSNPGNPAATAPVDNTIAARGACMLFIKQSLHDPDSAQFDSSDTAYVSSVGNVWTVQRGVRAKNAFNATRRAVYECKMREEGENWVPLSVRQLP